MKNHQSKNLFQIILDVVEYKVIIDSDDKMSGQKFEGITIPDFKWSSKLL